MREIKFRAWEVEKQRMFTFHLDGEHCGKFVYIPDVKGMIYIKDWSCSIFEPDNFIVMQYVGLKDKNGKEIYEGDIVSDGGVNWEIYWHEPTSQFGRRSDRVNEIDESPRALGMSSTWLEVVGNIYENHELLK